MAGMTTDTPTRYRQTFSDALQAIPLMENGDGLGWDQNASHWRIYALMDGTDLQPELIRIGDRVLSVTWTGSEIVHAATLQKKLH
jgi:hypothetical protein